MRNIEKIEKETNHDYAYRVLKENIINLELKPGQLLSEQDLADELKLSRTPVHEALQEISKTKIVEILPQRGSLVSLIDMTLVDEAVFMRSAIETAVISLACEMATEEQIKALEENVTLQEFYVSRGNVDNFLQLDNQFHECLYKMTNKMQCYEMVRTMNIHYDRFRELRIHTRENQTIVEEHKAILEALKERDKTKAKKMVKEHLSHLHFDEKEIRLKHAEFFKN